MDSPGSPLVRAKQKIEQVQGNKHVIKASAWFDKYLIPICKILICIFFANVGVTEFEYYYRYNVPGFPFLALPLIIASIAVMANFKTHLFGSFVAFMALRDSLHLSYLQISKWMWFNQPLYINELMVKKFSTFGCVLLILANDPYFTSKITSGAKALAGLIMDDPKHNIFNSQKLSVVLLTARLLISSLFLFVGYGEITRQLASGQPHHGHSHGRVKGDGHNSMWPKLIQFMLCLPFLVGFQTKNVARALAISLILEAMIYWQFWVPAEGLPFWYGSHSRDHFTVNVAVAGGLLLFQTMGAGRYSVDALLKKND